MHYKFILTLEEVPITVSIEISSIVYKMKAPQSSLYESRKKMLGEKKSPEIKIR